MYGESIVHTLRDLGIFNRHGASEQVRGRYIATWCHVVHGVAHLPVASFRVLAELPRNSHPKPAWWAYIDTCGMLAHGGISARLCARSLIRG